MIDALMTRAEVDGGWLPYPPPARVCPHTHFKLSVKHARNFPRAPKFSPGDGSTRHFNAPGRAFEAVGAVTTVTVCISCLLQFHANNLALLN